MPLYMFGLVFYHIETCFSTTGYSSILTMIALILILDINSSKLPIHVAGAYTNTLVQLVTLGGGGTPVGLDSMAKMLAKTMLTCLMSACTDCN